MGEHARAGWDKYRPIPAIFRKNSVLVPADGQKAYDIDSPTPSRNNASMPKDIPSRPQLPPALARMMRIHDELLENRLPNATTLSKLLEELDKTINRDIADRCGTGCTGACRSSWVPSQARRLSLIPGMSGFPLRLAVSRAAFSP